MQRFPVGLSFVGVLGLWLLLSSAMAAPIAQAATPSGTVNGTVVNVRSGPGSGYRVVAKVQAGQNVSIVGRNADGTWWKICCPAGQGTESWISAEFVTEDFQPTEALTLVPLATTTNATGGTPAAPAPRNTGGGQVMLLPGTGSFPAPGALNPLTGLPLPAGRAGQRPLLACINNDAIARPQYGIGQADVMYEYIMEGWWITRFTAVFYGQSPTSIGPIRSARLINYHLGALYDGGTICSGASDPVRFLLKKQNPYPYLDVDLDDASTIHYTSSVTRDYRTRIRTSGESLRRWLADWKVERTPSVRGFTFGELPANGTTAATIDIPYPRGTQVFYRYDATTGRYLRSMGGVAHKDAGTGAQVSVENVVVQFAPHEVTNIVEDNQGGKSIRISLFGSGAAILFRDGQAFVGTWRSDATGDTPRFYDADGGELALKPGQSWISVVPSNYKVTYR